jgi:hypothetical protein
MRAALLQQASSILPSMKGAVAARTICTDGCVLLDCVVDCVMAGSPRAMPTIAAMHNGKMN